MRCDGTIPLKGGVALKSDYVPVTDVPVVKVYRVRWLILVIFIMYGAMIAVQWLQYSIITNLVMKYYNVSASSVDWSSAIFFFIAAVLIVPAAFAVDKWGLRVAALWGATTSALGAVVKLFSIGPDLFYVVMIGQGLAGISQTFIFTLPPKIASTWFLPEEASTVCSLGVFSLTFGTALSFFIPPLIVKDHVDPGDIGSDLKVMCWGLAIPATMAALVVFFYFPKQPPHAPCLTAHYLRENRSSSVSIYLKYIKELSRNKPFLLHVLSYTCVFGTFSAFDTILNQLVLQYFEDAQEDAGRMGGLMLVIGIPSTVLVGIVLDKTRRFKESAIVITLFAALLMGGFLFALEMKVKWMCYVAIGGLGFFFSAYLPLGFELATELTYPLPENIVSSILVALSQVISIGMTIVLSDLNIRYGAFFSLLAQVGILAFGTLTTIVMPNRLFRQEAFKQECSFKDIKFQKVNQEEKQIEN